MVAAICSEEYRNAVEAIVSRRSVVHMELGLLAEKVRVAAEECKLVRLLKTACSWEQSEEFLNAVIDSGQTIRL
jgi:hypothetical protein